MNFAILKKFKKIGTESRFMKNIIFFYYQISIHQKNYKILELSNN